MLAYVVLGLLAAVSAAPQRALSIDDGNTLETYVNNKFKKLEAESRSFWDKYEREVSTFEEKMKNLSRHFPNPILQEGFDGDKYVIKISLHGFDTDDISVHVKDKAVVIEAHHSNGVSDNNFFKVRALPENIRSGFWSYENDVLTVECELE